MTAIKCGVCQRQADIVRRDGEARCSRHADIGRRLGESLGEEFHRMVTSPPGPNLGLASTRELLEELRGRARSEEDLALKRDAEMLAVIADDLLNACLFCARAVEGT